MEILWVVTGIFAALFIFYAIRTLIYMRFGARTKGTRLTKILGRYARIRSYKVLENVKLEYRGKIVTIDNILIGFFGMMVLTNMHERGEYYGDAKDAQWVQSLDGGKMRIPNPVLKNITNVEALRAMFGKYDMYNLNIEDYVVFTAHHKGVQLFISHAPNVMSLKKFKRMLYSTKYEEDKDYDVEKMYQIILDNQEED